MVWSEKYERRDLSVDIEILKRASEYYGKIAALERKVGQLAIELDLLKSEIQHSQAQNHRLLSQSHRMKLHKRM